MQITINEQEAQALMIISQTLRTAATPTPKFLDWCAERLIKHCGDSELVDYIQKLREYADIMRQLSSLLNIQR